MKALDTMKTLQPIRSMSLPPKLVGVAFDVDDTLTRDGVLEAAAFGALHALREAGLRLIAISGRPLGWAEVWARQWPVHAAIGENGAGWFWREGDSFREGYAVDLQTRKQIEATHQKIREAARAIPGARESSDSRLRRYDLAFDVAEEQVMADEHQEALAALIRTHGATPITSSVHCHAELGYWDKARSIEAAATSIWGTFAIDDWIFVGDSGNDAPAFARFPYSVGVANVRERSVASLPKFVTDASRGQGFSELATHVLSELKGRPTQVEESPAKDERAG